MLIGFFSTLRKERLPVSLGELFSLIECMKHNFAFASIDEFYLLARMCMVKDEKHYDKFDRAFSRYFNQLQTIDDILQLSFPDEWLRRQFEASLSEEEKAQIEAMGGLEKLLEEFRKR